MEKGQMRVEVNISVSKIGDKLGTKVEIKNINSFRAVERAIAFETERQRAILESGEVVLQETRGWDENLQQTFSQRAKENSDDYRYFPDPDIPKLQLDIDKDFTSTALSSQLPELPNETRLILQKQYSVVGESAEQLVRSMPLRTLFLTTLQHAQIQGDLVYAQRQVRLLSGLYRYI